MARMICALLPLALFGSATFAQDAPPSPGRLAAAPVVDAINKAVAAEAAMPPARTTREKLERLGRLDQAGRAHIEEVGWAKLSPADVLEARNAIVEAMDPVDQANIDELRKLLPKDGWFSREEFGEEAADAAFHILQHSGDMETKKRVLPHLQALALKGDIRGANFAAMYDRIATSEGRPQRYGTQFRCVARKIEPFPVEDPNQVERLRAELKLDQTFADSDKMHRGKPCG